jgi:hypothetical protein
MKPEDLAEIKKLGEAFGEQALAESATAKGKSLAEFKDLLLDALRAERASREITAWPYVFKFAKPVEVFGDTIAALTLREPSADDLIKHGVFDDQIDGNQLLDLIGTLSGQTPSTVRKLPGADMLRLSKRLMRVFLLAA